MEKRKIKGTIKGYKWKQEEMEQSEKGKKERITKRRKD